MVTEEQESEENLGETPDDTLNQNTPPAEVNADVLSGDDGDSEHGVAPDGVSLAIFGTSLWGNNIAGMAHHAGESLESGVFGFSGFGQDLLEHFESGLHAGLSSQGMNGVPRFELNAHGNIHLLPDHKSNDTSIPPPEPSYPFGISDPLFPDQWGLHNVKYSGVDINVLPVWEEFTGKDVIVGLIDDGVDLDHPELQGNYLSAFGYDAQFDVNDPSPKFSNNNHGTATSSVIVGARNGVGIVGVAYDASFSMVRMPSSIPADAEAMLANAITLSSYADVVNMSYGGTKFSYSAIGVSAIDDLVTNGRGGLGTPFVLSAGNDRPAGELFSYGYKAAMPDVIGVGSINPDGSCSYFSEPGASLLVTAPGRNMMLADRQAPYGYNSGGDYNEGSGTSYSAPMVTGVISLILQANPELGNRDIMNILALTSGKTGNCFSDPTNPWDWQINGAENWNGGGMHVSHDYGFGLVNAHAAVRLAESWDQGVHTAGNVEFVTQSVTPGIAIADGGSVTSTINIGSSFAVEYAQVVIDIPGGRAADLTIILTSPDGTQSWLMDGCPDSWMDLGWPQTFGTSSMFPFGSNQCRGEDGQGTWTLTVQDAAGGGSPTLNYWSLKLFGDSPDSDDLYVYTDEFSTFAAEDGARTLLTDADGTDSINASAVTSDSIIDLRSGFTSSIDGTSLEIAAGTVIENAHAGDGDDVLTGNAVDNQLFGWRGSDSIFGGAGADSLFGGAGGDTLSGGVGSDLFRYEMATHGGDTILDFSHADDNFGFDFSQFGQASAGTLDGGHFFVDLDDVSGSDACFIFEADVLWFDADGDGATEAVEIATVSGDDVLSGDITFV